MKIKRFVGGNLESNCYIISNQEEGYCYVIDPGYDGKKITDYIVNKKLKPLGIILTHHHHDHTGAALKVKENFSCDIMIHEYDSYQTGIPTDRMIKDGDIIMLDDERLLIRNTPGHTRGSICIVASKSKVIFTGDTVFGNDLGRTDLADGSEKEMRETCRNIVNLWSNEYTIYPGHEESASMKHVRKYNREFLDCLV